MEREVHGGELETKQFIQGFIADSYMDIQASRLMTIRCAELMDQGVDARTYISASKIFVPAAMHRGWPSHIMIDAPTISNSFKTSPNS